MPRAAVAVSGLMVTYVACDLLLHHLHYRWLVDHAPEETAQQNATSHSQQAEQEHVQQDLQDQEQQQQVRDAHVPTVAAAAAAGLDNNLGALNLLRAYSMNSEADSEPGDCFGQEQQQQQQAEAEQAAYETEPLVYGPALPPPGTSAAANQPYSMEEYGLEQPAQNIPDSLQQTREEQQKQSRSPSPEPIAAAAEPAAPGTEEPVAAAPPDQVKAIIDKLVAFVKKNGIKFEVREGRQQMVLTVNTAGTRAYAMYQSSPVGQMC